MSRIILTIVVTALLLGNAVSQQKSGQDLDALRAKAATREFQLAPNVETALAIGRMISDAPEKPRFNPGD